MHHFLFLFLSVELLRYVVDVVLFSSLLFDLLKGIPNTVMIDNKRTETVY